MVTFEHSIFRFLRTPDKMGRTISFIRPTGACLWVQFAAFPQDCHEGLGRDDGDAFVSLEG